MYGRFAIIASKRCVPTGSARSPWWNRQRCATPRRRAFSVATSIAARDAIGRVNDRRRFRRNGARDRAAAGADVEHAHRSANETQRIVHQMLGFGARDEHALVHDELAPVEPRAPEKIRDRHAGGATTRRAFEMRAHLLHRPVLHRAPRSTRAAVQARARAAAAHRHVRERLLRVKRWISLESSACAQVKARVRRRADALARRRSARR